MKALAITQFKITTPSGIFVSGEYEGNPGSGEVIVFVHGFGVKRDSRGMFTDISMVLNNKFLIVRYDSFLTEENDEIQRKVLEYSKQAEMLTGVLEYIGREFRPAHVYIIAHSMGGPSLVSRIYRMWIRSFCLLLLLLRPMKQLRIIIKTENTHILMRVERAFYHIRMVPKVLWTQNFGRK